MNYMPISRIIIGPKAECTVPNCPICAPGLRPFMSSEWAYQTATKPDTGPVVDFTGSGIDWSSNICGDPDCSICGTSVASENTTGNEYTPLSNTERVTDLEEEVQNLRAAVLDLTQVVEYLLIWTGKKGNKLDRDKYLDGYIDPIRVIL